MLMPNRAGISVDLVDFARLFGVAEVAIGIAMAANCVGRGIATRGAARTATSPSKTLILKFLL